MANFGIPGLKQEPGDVYAVAQDGFATYDISYTGVLTGPVPFLQGDVSGNHPNTVLLSVRVTGTGLSCNHVKIDLHYEGRDYDFAGPSTAQNISVDFTTSQEPIESNPNFVAAIGGQPTAPLHGAFFDATTGEFLGFPVIDPSEPTSLPSRFAGLRSYLMPQETFTSNSVEIAYPSDVEIANVGFVFDPMIPLPVLPGNRSWLNTGIRVQNIANVYFRRQDTGMLSGPRNWIPEIYGSL